MEWLLLFIVVALVAYGGQEVYARLQQSRRPALTTTHPGYLPPANPSRTDTESQLRQAALLLQQLSSNDAWGIVPESAELARTWVKKYMNSNAAPYEQLKEGAAILHIIESQDDFTPMPRDIGPAVTDWLDDYLQRKEGTS